MHVPAFAHHAAHRVDHQLALVDLLRDPVYTHDLSLGLLTDLAYAVVFLAAAWARFSSKDVTS